MLAFLWKVVYCVAAAGLLTAVSAGSFVAGYHGGYRQALRDEKQRFPTLVPSQPPTREWSEFLNSRSDFPAWLDSAPPNSSPLTAPAPKPENKPGRRSARQQRPAAPGSFSGQ
jgi:hypothetical protein